MHSILDELVKALTGQHQDSQHIQDAQSNFVNTAINDDSLLTKAVELLPQLPYGAASILSVLIGAVTENNQKVAIASPGITSLFLIWLDKLPTPLIKEDEEVELPALDNEQQDIAENLPNLCRSLVSHLARDPEQRQLFSTKENRSRVSHLLDYSSALHWVLELIERQSGEVLLLNPTNIEGYVIRYTNVGNWFQLFSLIQHQLGNQIHATHTPNEDIAEAARGDCETDDIGDEAWWHYGDCHSPEPNIVASIWGEADVASIPEYQGQKIILLWPKQIGSRQWDSSFFGVPLQMAPASVELVRQLSTQQTKNWLNDLGIQTATTYSVNTTVTAETNNSDALSKVETPKKLPFYKRWFQQNSK